MSMIYHDRQYCSGMKELIHHFKKKIALNVVIFIITAFQTAQMCSNHSLMEEKSLHMCVYSVARGKKIIRNWRAKQLQQLRSIETFLVSLTEKRTNTIQWWSFIQKLAWRVAQFFLYAPNVLTYTQKKSYEGIRLSSPEGGEKNHRKDLGKTYSNVPLHTGVNCICAAVMSLAVDTTLLRPSYFQDFGNFSIDAEIEMQ